VSFLVVADTAADAEVIASNHVWDHGIAVGDVSFEVTRIGNAWTPGAATPTHQLHGPARIIAVSDVDRFGVEA
jgi:hypothetical protein